ncbi:MAG: D-aminoacyl-tRNA deacylase [Bacteroidota bacterium]|nr:D-aminoacyl-tRNA deacylase [Bacteroidota bacterium]
MRAVIQRVSQSSVSVNGSIKSSIDRGLMILVGIEDADNQKDMDWLSRKICNMRIFDDKDGVMNLSVKAIDGELLLISQFTLHAATKKGNRPSYIHAAKPPVAIPLYNDLKRTMELELGKEIQSGEFGADMKVELINDGPVTIIIDSKNKEI